MIIPESSECTDGQVRLMYTSLRQGIVEVCIGSNWGTVCRDGWGNNNAAAAVVCEQLGYGRNGILIDGCQTYLCPHV